MRVQALNVGPLQACCYIVAPDEGTDAAVIDPGGDAELILAKLRAGELSPRLIVVVGQAVPHDVQSMRRHPGVGWNRTNGRASNPHEITFSTRRGLA